MMIIARRVEDHHKAQEFLEFAHDKWFAGELVQVLWISADLQGGVFIYIQCHNRRVADRIDDRWQDLLNRQSGVDDT